MTRIKDILKRPIFQNPTFLAIVWLGIVVVMFLIRLHKGVNNNYVIFSQSFWHALAEKPLHIEYPAEYGDQFLYGISFTALIAPFALLPDIIGALVWILANSLFLFIAIKQLGVEKWKFAFIIWISVNEMVPPILAFQYNIGITGMILLSFAFIEKKKEFWSALMIMLGAMTKIYGIVGLAFFFFSKRKLHLIGGILFWGILLFLLPMTYSSPQYVIDEYRGWLDVLIHKNDLTQV